MELKGILKLDKLNVLTLLWYDKMQYHLIRASLGVIIIIIINN